MTSMNFIGLDIHKKTISRLAENLNSNICDGSGLRQQMDVWFCVPRRNQNKSARKGTAQTYVFPRPPSAARRSSLPS